MPLKRVDFDDSEVRQLLPGLAYTLPPKPARPDFLETSAAAIVATACEGLARCTGAGQDCGGRRPRRRAGGRLPRAGETPALACDLTAEEKAGLAAAIDELKATSTPTAARPPRCVCPSRTAHRSPWSSSFFVPQQYGSAAIFDPVSVLQRDASRDYYATKDRAERLRQKSRELYKAVHNMYDRAVRKQAARKGGTEPVRQGRHAAPVRRALQSKPLGHPQG